MTLAQSLARQDKLAIFRHYLPVTDNIFPRKSRNQAAKHFHLNPPKGIVSDLTPRTHQLLDEIRKAINVESATALISHFSKQNQHREAIICFSTMPLRGIRPNEYTFSAALHSSVALKDLHLGKQMHSFAKKIGLSPNVFVGSAILDLYVKLSNIDDGVRAFNDIHEPNVVSYATLLSGYVKEGWFNEAVEVFRSMPEKNVVSWNTMISGCSQTGKNEEAVNFLVEMLREGVIPTEFTFPCAIIAAANTGSLGIGRSIHACAVKFLGNPGLFLANSLISFYAKCGSMEESLFVFKKMHKRNIVSWNAVICGYAWNGEGNGAIEMYEKMTKEGIQPNSVTVLNLLLACTHVGLVNEGYKYFNKVRHEDPSLLKPEHYACMIDLLSRSGRFHEAEKFLRDLPFDPGVGFWKALLGGCQVHSNLELGEVAARKILELDPGDVSSYVMLSNAHSAAGRWQNVLNVRQKMREKGLSRIPGSSWIEVKSKVHVFVTGDKRHSNMDEIYMALGFLLEHVMDSGDTDLVTEYHV